MTYEFDLLDGSLVISSDELGSISADEQDFAVVPEIQGLNFYISWRKQSLT